jgi:intracellular sulfur oxidation DsrE/DsrF family protein
MLDLLDRAVCVVSEVGARLDGDAGRPRGQRADCHAVVPTFRRITSSLGDPVRANFALTSTLFVLLVSSATALRAQALGPSRTGPAIADFGPVYTVEEPDFPTDAEATYRVVFEVSQGANDPGDINPRIETLARFLNMHAQVGVPRENMKLALVLHGTAGKDALGHEGYRKRFGTENPNGPLLEALSEYGVRVILCGQTQMHRGLGRDELSPEVEVALSAMTALVSLASEGYRLIGP